MKWREEEGGPVIRRNGELRARLNWTGSLWRGTVWTDKGTSSATGYDLKEAMAWCEGVLRYDAG
jgi:hypothetical protein